jgi:hypothetical protein
MGFPDYHSARQTPLRAMEFFIGLEAGQFFTRPKASSKVADIQAEHNNSREPGQAAGLWDWAERDPVKYERQFHGPG